MSNTNNIINTTSYDIQNKWINDIAPKYFQVDDINMLRAGIFGYLNEIMSNSLEDSVNMTSILGNEAYPNKAVLPNSVYSYAALANFSNFNAVPATIPFVLGIRKEDIIKYATQKSGYKEIIISRYSELNVNGDTFMIDYDIKIICKQTTDGKDYILTSQYIFDINNSLSSISNPYIDSSVLFEEGEPYLFLNLTAKQIKRTSVEFKVYTDDLVGNVYFPTKYDGNLASFNVFYKSATGSSYQQIDKYYVDSIRPDKERFCFYSYGDQTINIEFSAHPDFFKPEFNSNIKVEVYDTLGAAGNIKYTGENCEFIFYNPEGSTVNFSKLLHMVYILGSATGGTDAMTIDDVKYHSIKAFSVRNNIITDNDLNYYFKGLVSNCKMNFIKKRDDIIKRIYSSFLLLKDEDDNILPTNSISIIIPDDADHFDNYQKGGITFTLKPGKLISKSTTYENFYEIMDNNKTIEELVEEDKAGIYNYSLPYLLKVNTNPYFVSYYLNSVFDKYNIIFTYVNPDSLNKIIISDFEIERNAIFSDKYVFTFGMNTNINFRDLYEIYNEENSSKNHISGDLGHLKIKLIFTVNGIDIGYITPTVVDFYDNNPEYVKYTASITTNDLITESDEIVIKNSIYKFDGSNEILIEGCSIPSDEVKIKILVFYDKYDSKDKYTYNGSFPNMDNYCITNIYQTSSDIFLFKDVNNIEYSTILLKNGYYEIKTVPVFKYTYLYNSEKLKEVISLLNYFAVVLQQTLDVIENNFDIDMKFYNTYGESSYFTIGREGEMLQGTSISIEFNIRINVTLTDLISTDLTNFISSYVENVNNSDINGINFLYISNLIKELENNFEYITYTEFVGFNNYDSSYQIIENTFTNYADITTEQIIKYVPEYLNINRKSYIDNEGNIGFRPEIKLNFV